MTDLAQRLPPSIVTERLVLTTPVLAHVPAMATLANNRRIYEVLARLPHPYSEADGRQFVQEFARGDEEFAWSILLGDDYIGTMGLHLLPGQAPELGYWLGEPYWGHGCATEAARAVVAAARAAGATELRSSALVTNSGSRNVLRKAGFTEIGEGPSPCGTNAGALAVFLRLKFVQ